MHLRWFVIWSPPASRKGQISLYPLTWIIAFQFEKQMYGLDKFIFSKNDFSLIYVSEVQI